MVLNYQRARKGWGVLRTPGTVGEEKPFAQRGKTKIKHHLSFSVGHSGVGKSLLCSQSSSPLRDTSEWAANQGRAWGLSSSARHRAWLEHLIAGVCGVTP